MSTRTSKLALSVGALLMAGSVWASTTATMNATAIIQEECAVGNVTGIGFSALSMLNNAAPTQQNSETSATFDAICTNATDQPQFTFSSANTTGTDFRLGTARWQGTYIPYKLYTDVDGYQQAVTGGVATEFGMMGDGFMANGTTQQLTLVAKILAADKVGKPTADDYADTITITVSWNP